MSNAVQATESTPRLVDIGPLRPEETRQVAQLHFDFFGGGGGHGHSLALLGVDFLEDAFYRQNLDNPYLFVDVARYQGEVIAFSVYSSDHRKVFRYTIRKHFLRLAWALAKCVLRHPRRTAANLLGNQAFLTEALPAETRQIPGWFILLGVKQPYRSREFQQRSGVWIAGEFKQRLERTLREKGCREYWAAPFAENEAAILFYKKINAQLFAEGTVQGIRAHYYRMSIV
jgi:hypothetical protein